MLLGITVEQIAVVNEPVEDNTVHSRHRVCILHPGIEAISTEIENPNPNPNPNLN